MKKTLQHILGIAFFVITTSLFAQTPTQLFETGNTHYADGRYQEAIDAYNKILNQDMESTALYFNLANAHFKLNNVAPSIYYYEKAKRLAPADPEIKNNASFVAKMKIDDITPLPENIFSKSFNKVLYLLTTDSWAYATIISVFLFVAFFLGYYFTNATGLKRTLFIGSFVSLLIAGLSLIFAYNAFAKAKNNHLAIVFAKESQVKSEPDLASTDAFLLHEGSKVLVLESVKKWQHIKLADGTEGWILATDIKEL